MSKRWYVVHAHSGYEKKVQDALREKIEQKEMTEYFGDVLVPMEDVVEVRGGQRSSSERKFFPGYVMVEMELNERTWHLVKSIPRVLGFIGGKPDSPEPLRESEVDVVLRRVRISAAKPRLRTMFEAGETVRVIEGPFNDFNGVVEEVNNEKGRLKVSVSIFGHSTPVELEFSQVEKS